MLPWQDFVNFGEVNRLALAYAREALKAGKTPEQADDGIQAAREAQRGGLYLCRRRRGGPGGNFGIIFEELKTAK